MSGIYETPDGQRVHGDGKPVGNPEPSLMKIELATAKIRKGKSGTFRALKPGELIEEGDLLFHLGFVCDIRNGFGKPVKEAEAIIRLEFEK